MPFPRPELPLGIRLAMGRVRVFLGVGADEFEFRTRPHLHCPNRAWLTYKDQRIFAVPSHVNGCPIVLHL